VDEEEEVSSLLEEEEQVVVSNDFTLHTSAVDRGCVRRHRNDGDEKIMLLSSSSSFMGETMRLSLFYSLSRRPPHALVLSHTPPHHPNLDDRTGTMSWRELRNLILAGRVDILSNNAPPTSRSNVCLGHERHTRSSHGSYCIFFFFLSSSSFWYHLSSTMDGVNDILYSR
jgi:hypothetical protein